jgi:hypothetical protein
MDIKKLKIRMLVRISNDLAKTNRKFGNDLHQQKTKGRIGRIIDFYKSFGEVCVQVDNTRHWYHPDDLLDIGKETAEDKPKPAIFDPKNLILEYERN